uniref:F-box domain-containing protein n=1 Tax=Aegilops tauschii subsp. strangulata TaxID=200361 RepID=A0A453MIJ1_AEGTS
AAAAAQKFPTRNPRRLEPPGRRPHRRCRTSFLEEIFLLLPPDEAEHLLRASLANKFWLGLLSGARFRGRYREFHGAPPMLGFLYSCHWNSRPKMKDNIPHFVPTTKFRACIPDDDWGDWEYDAWDCRHGRVLLGDAGYKPMTLVVWDPMTGCRRELDAPVLVDNSYGAAVLCAASGCDHSTCHAGPFQVVFIALNKTDAHHCVAQAWVTLPVTGDHSNPILLSIYRSHFDKWSNPCSGLHLDSDVYIHEAPPVFIQDTLHFKLCSCVDDRLVGILMYDISTNCLSLIDMPLAGSIIADDVILMVMEDDSLGFAHVGGLILNLWSRHMGSDGVASWTQRTVININDILPIRNPKKRLRLIGSVEGTDIIFVTTDLGIYKINLKSLQWKERKVSGFHPIHEFLQFTRVTPSDAAH